MDRRRRQPGVIPVQHRGSAHRHRSRRGAPAVSAADPVDRRMDGRGRRGRCRLQPAESGQIRQGPADERDRRALLFPTRNESALAPTVVQIGEDFIGAVMPIKPAGGAETYQPRGWLRHGQYRGSAGLARHGQYRGSVSEKRDNGGLDLDGRAATSELGGPSASCQTAATQSASKACHATSAPRPLRVTPARNRRSADDPPKPRSAATARHKRPTRSYSPAEMPRSSRPREACARRPRKPPGSGAQGQPALLDVRGTPHLHQAGQRMGV